jgi:hypothetical protein
MRELKMKTQKEIEVFLIGAKKELLNATSPHDVAFYGGMIQALKAVLNFPHPLDEWPEI